MGKDGRLDVLAMAEIEEADETSRDIGEEGLTYHVIGL